MNKIQFNDTWMYYNWFKVKWYSKSFSVLEKSNWIDKSCEIKWIKLDWIIIIDEIITY